MNKLTAVAGVAALCMLGATAAAGAQYRATHPQRLATVGAAQTALMSDTVAASTTFTGGTSIVSANGDYQLLMKTSGNLVENSLHGISPVAYTYMGGTSYYSGGNASAVANNSTVTGTYVGEDVTRIWQSGTADHSGARAVLQSDGNFVIYSASNAVLWASHTAGHPGTTLAVQNDGNVVLYDNGRALWATHRVSIVNGSATGSPTVNFRVCPGVQNNPVCQGSLQQLPNGTGITMLCWEDEPDSGLNPPPPTDRWFYALVDGSQENLGYLNASVVEDQTQITTPACIPPESPAPPVPATPKTVPPLTSSTGPGGGGGGGTTGTTYTETVGGPTHTWTDYSDAGGTQGATIATSESVQVTCVAQGFKVADGNTNWYKVASAPWSNAYYASADAFYNNGATSGSLHGTPFVDPKVPAC
jgi:hypothetical protein